MDEALRICPTCKVEQPIATHFARNATRPKRNYQYECKTCRSARNRARVAGTPRVDDAAPDATRVCRVCSVERPLHVGFPKRPGGYRTDCKVCVNVRAAAKRASSPAQREREKQYRESKKDESRAWFAEHYKRNREKKLRQASEWANNNRSAYRANMRLAQHRRAARLLGKPTEPYTVELLLERDGSDCVLCGEALDLTATNRAARSVSVEHLVCISWPDFPGDVPSNVALSHYRCNTLRGPRPHPAAAAKRAQLLDFYTGEASAPAC